jgi:hypothetical protein
MAPGPPLNSVLQLKPSQHALQHGRCQASATAGSRADTGFPNARLRTRLCRFMSRSRIGTCWHLLRYEKVRLIPLLAAPNLPSGERRCVRASDTPEDHHKPLRTGPPSPLYRRRVQGMLAHGSFSFGAQLKTATSKQHMVSHEERHGFRRWFASFERAGGRVGRILQVRSQNEGEGGDDGDHETQGPEAKEGERGRASQTGGIVTKLNDDLL